MSIVMTRSRYLELTEVANELVDWLKHKSVGAREACTVRAIAEQLWQLEYPLGPPETMPITPASLIGASMEYLREGHMPAQEPLNKPAEDEE